MYIRVYAPNGEPFDVSRERADMCILTLGWTQTAPVNAVEVETTSPVEIVAEDTAVDEPVEEVPVVKLRKRRSKTQD